MKTRVQQNIVWRTNEIVWGVSIMVPGGRMYCKYPIGHQNYKTKDEAQQAMNDIDDILAEGGTIKYAAGKSAGLNKSEYVDIKIKEI